MFVKQQLGIALIQEPWHHKNQVKGLNIPNTKVIWDSSLEQPRACLIVKNSINHTCLSEHISKDLVAIRCELTYQSKPLDIVIASAYLAGDREAPPSELTRLVQYCKVRKIPLLIGCDANAHNDVWGSTNNNNRGDSLLEFILGENLSIFNIGNTPTFVTKNRKEVLDITFGSPFVENLTHNWQVSSEPSMSDHRIIRFDLGIIPKVTTSSRNPRKTNWSNYTNFLEENLNSIKSNYTASTPAELEQWVLEVNNSITNAFENSCPQRQANTKKEVPWWNQDLALLRTKTRKLFNTAKRNGNWEEYKKTLTLYNIEIRKAKRKNFQEFCASIESTTEAARIYKAFGADFKYNHVNLRKANGEYTENEDERTQLLLKTHFPGSIEQVTMNPLDGNKKPTKEDWKMARTICTHNRVVWAISNLQPYKSPGIDGIIPILLQKGLQVLTTHLIGIFRSSLAMGYIPIPWRRAKVVFIPKAGKKDTNDPKSYRPISLTSFLLKTLEKVVDNYIRNTNLIEKPLHHSQHAYRAGRSTETALYQLTTHIQSSLDSRETCICAFLDIEGAFDNTSHTTVRRSLTERNVNKTVVDWIDAMLNTRTAESKAMDKVTQIQTTRGCPQGGVLSPLLWSLVVDELLNILNNQGLTALGYADDIVLITKGKYENTMCDIIHNGLKIIHKWCTEAGLRINPSKTTLIPFTKKHKLPLLKSMIFNDQTLSWSSETKYLGLTLDKKMLWNKHIETQTNKATKAFMVCRRLAGNKWGTSPHILLWMYTTMIRPIITYGALMWEHRTHTKKSQQMLNKVQKLAGSCITGSLRTCPAAAIDRLLGITPISIAVWQQAQESRLRMLLKEQEKGNKILQVDMAKLTKILPLSVAPNDYLPKQVNFTKNFTIMLEPPTDKTNKANQWYTDGSKTTTGTGIGIVGPHKRTSEPLGIHTSIFQAEILAIERCASINLNNKTRNKHINIFTDSQAALKALKGYTVNHRCVLSCIETLNKLGTDNKITIGWIPGHKGNRGNEIADKLAKIGATTPFVGPEPGLGLSHSYLKQLLKTKVLEKTNLHWENIPKLRQSKILLGQHDIRRQVLCRNLSKSNLHIIARLLTGHNTLNGHLHKLGLHLDGICRFCEQNTETSEHILMDCWAISHKRQKCLGRPSFSKEQIVTVDISSLIRFIKAIGLEDTI